MYIEINGVQIQPEVEFEPQARTLKELSLALTRYARDLAGCLGKCYTSSSFKIFPLKSSDFSMYILHGKISNGETLPSPLIKSSGTVDILDCAYYAGLRGASTRIKHGVVETDSLEPVDYFVLYVTDARLKVSTKDGTELRLVMPKGHQGCGDVEGLVTNTIKLICVSGVAPFEWLLSPAKPSGHLVDNIAIQEYIDGNVLELYASFDGTSWPCDYAFYQDTAYVTVTDAIGDQTEIKIDILIQTI